MGAIFNRSYKENRLDSPCGSGENAASAAGALAASRRPCPQGFSTRADAKLNSSFVPPWALRRSARGPFVFHGRRTRNIVGASLLRTSINDPGNPRGTTWRAPASHIACDYALILFAAASHTAIARVKYASFAMWQATAVPFPKTASSTTGLRVLTASKKFRRCGLVSS